MNILSVQTDSDKLHLKSTHVSKEEWQTNIKPVIPSMIEGMIKGNGVGLAAPQCDIQKRMFIIKISDTHAEVIINPIIHKYYKDFSIQEEGCLSCPGKLVKVKRSNKIKVTYINDMWLPQTKTLSGMLARIFQHEYDHLEGKLIADLPSE